MGKHSGDDDLNFFELKNAKVHIYTAQPTWVAADEGRLIYVTVAEPDPAKRGFFKGTDSGWVNMATGGIGGVDVEENDALIVAGATPLDFVSDIAGGKEFAEVIDDGVGGVEIEVDKQIDYLELAGSVGPVPTGFTFDAETYRACEVIYAIEKYDGKLETGHIMMMHDNVVAGVVVTRRGSELLPFTEGNPAVVFSADIDTGPNPDVCRLLYTETDGQKFHLGVKPRPIRPNQIVNVEFVLSASLIVDDVPSTHQVDIRINTSDGNPVGAPGGAGGQATDVGTGSAGAGIDYTFAIQNPNWLQGALDGDIISVDVVILGTDVDATIDLGLAAIFGCRLGPTTTHIVTLQSAGA